MTLPAPAWPGSLAVVASPGVVDELAALFVFLADTDFHGYSPIYERLSRSVATDAQLLAFIADAVSPNVRRGRVPVLFLAATHDLTLAHPEGDLAAIYRGQRDADPYPALLAMLDDHRAEVASTLASRSVQTNEVGRSAALVPAVSSALAGDHRAVALVEVGPSAGLNLFLDRYRVNYLPDQPAGADGPLVGAGPPDSTVQLDCRLRGDGVPPLDGLPTIAVRTGVDPSPVDVTDPVQRRWLQACLWPGQPRRARTLAAAMDLVASAPPELLGGDAVTDLAAVVGSQPSDVVPVVVSTWAMAYIPADGRGQILAALDALGAGRDLSLVTMEEPRFTPWLDVLDHPTVASGDGTPTALGVRSWRDGRCTTTTLALCHPHAQWMRWLA
jgi:hypothetical protein